jgi:hypothetical protein
MQIGGETHDGRANYKQNNFQPQFGSIRSPAQIEDLFRQTLVQSDPIDVFLSILNVFWVIFGVF